MFLKHREELFQKNHIAIKSLLRIVTEEQVRHCDRTTNFTTQLDFLYPNWKEYFLKGCVTAVSQQLMARLIVQMALSIAECSDSAAETVLRAASENADFLARHAGKQAGAFPSTPARPHFVREDVSDVEQKIYIDFIRELDAYIESRYPSLASRFVSARADSSEKLLAVSDGSDCHSILARSYVYIGMTATTDSGTPVEMYEIAGGLGTFDLNFTDPALLYPRIDELYRRIMEKREGVYAEAGQKTCILAGSLTGMLAHEAVGHTVEADLVIGGSVAAHNLGCRVASDKVTLVDFAHTALGERAPLPVYVDDEGVAAEDALIIDRGMLVGYMNSRETAVRFGMKPTGNARAYLFSDEPLIRMRNTAILPGTDKLAEMIESVEDGYIFDKTNNGQADTTGEFMFGVTGGYEIKNGKIGRAILDTTISGVAFDMLKTVDMVSDKMVWASSGMCGKKQPMPVGMGGPAIRCKVTVGGR